MNTHSVRFNNLLWIIMMPTFVKKNLLMKVTYSASQANSQCPSLVHFPFWDIDLQCISLGFMGGTASVVSFLSYI